MCLPRLYLSLRDSDIPLKDARSVLALTAVGSKNCPSTSDILTGARSSPKKESTPRAFSKSLGFVQRLLLQLLSHVVKARNMLGEASRSREQLILDACVHEWSNAEALGRKAVSMQRESFLPSSAAAGSERVFVRGEHTLFLQANGETRSVQDYCILNILKDS